MNIDLLKVVSIFSAWFGLAVFLMLIAAGRVLAVYFPSVRRRHLVCGVALGSISPIFIALLNDAFDAFVSPLTQNLLSRLYDMEKIHSLGPWMVEQQRHLTTETVQGWLSLRDYIKDFILIFSAGVGGNLIAGSLMDWHKSETIDHLQSDLPQTEHVDPLQASCSGGRLPHSLGIGTGRVIHMNNQASEEDILRVFIEEMEARGEGRQFVRLDVDQSMVEKINSAKGSAIDLEQLCRLADRCLANEWLEHTVVGGRQIWTSFINGHWARCHKVASAKRRSIGQKNVVEKGFGLHRRTQRLISGPRCRHCSNGPLA
ncbi:hypothetical protein [Sulfuricella sp.]|uniref:hypothetical protein n=1 Tax=Sulfuricella sp. TaxID=2099377 RepID=UPI002C37C741|nr:hypothetical protein [Sulfuricella sp.]HUX62220.1 hypothetical protein [Sulfuricella sp.]